MCVTGCAILFQVIWPVLALPAKDFSEAYFTFWTIIMIVWGLVAAVAMIFMVCSSLS